MKISEAQAIFEDIEREDKTIEEKGAAIYRVLNMSTYNRITKKNMFKVIRWLFKLSFTTEKEKNENEKN